MQPRVIRVVGRAKTLMSKKGLLSGGGLAKVFDAVETMQRGGEQPSHWVVSPTAQTEIILHASFGNPSPSVRNVMHPTFISGFATLLGYPVIPNKGLGERMGELVGANGTRITFQIPKFESNY